MILGEPFNPFGLFHGLFVPEALSRYRGVSAGAKLAYGRLARYAGQNGECYPATDTLGAEVGVSERQARKYIAELEKAAFIRRVARFKNGAQTSNGFQFLWHAIFDGAPQPCDQGRNDTSGGRRTDSAAGGRNDTSGEESHCEESHSENSDIDCLITNRKDRDSQSADLSPSVCRQYPRLREILCLYMREEPTAEKIYPNDRHVVDVMDAAGGATEEEVISCLKYLYSERGLKPGTRNGPRHFSWFVTVVQDYFNRREERDEVANPSGFHDWRTGIPSSSLSGNNSTA